MAAMAMAARVKIPILAAIALWQMGWGAGIDTMEHFDLILLEPVTALGQNLTQVMSVLVVL